MNLGNMVSTWFSVLSQPSRETMAQTKEQPGASLGTGLLWIMIAAVITAIFGYLQVSMALGGATGMEAMMGQMDLPPEMQEQMDQLFDSGMFAGMLGGASLASLFLAPIAFFFWTGLYHLIANLLGGEGSYGRFAFLYAAINAPLTILSAVLGFIPLLGSCLALLMSIYGIVLLVFAVGAEYHLSNGRSVAVVLLPLVILFGLAICGFIVVVGSLATLGGG